MKQNAGYAVLVAVALAAARLGGGSGGQVVSPPIGRPATVQSKTTVNMTKSRTYTAGCTAYLGGEETGKGLKDPNRGAAKSLLNRFFRLDTAKEMAPQLAARPGIRYAIALAPDPVHTNLGLLFDREMVAVQQGAQDEGYTYDSAWLPWTGEGSKFPLRADQEAADEDRGHREGCPGLLLFRKSLADPQPEAAKPADPYAEALVVFVVGEQPTAGINESQWANAVHWLAENTSPTAGAGTLRILGPSFSGSLVSLERDLSALYGQGAAPLNTGDLAAKFPRVRILSGDVSSCASVRWFQDNLQRGGLAPAVRFGGFYENDELQIFRFFSYLNRLGTDIRDTAILSEDETAYGYHVTSEVKGSQASGSPCDFPYAEDQRPLRLSYPRDISALRTAYEKQAVFDSSGLTGKKSRIVLQDDTGEGSEGAATSDTIKSFAGPTTAVAQEAVLYGVVSYLRVHHTRYLLLRCTNPLDTLFLTRFFHRAYPEGRIVTVGSDLFYRREIDTTEFRGVLALTSYPLLPLNQHWSQMTQNTALPISHVHRVLESQVQAGTYLAARYLFDAVTDLPPLTVVPAVKKKCKQAKAPLPAKREDSSLPWLENIPDYADPFWFHLSGQKAATVAPTWLAVVGSDGYWPVAVLNKETTPDVLLNMTNPRPQPPVSTLISIDNSNAHYKPGGGAKLTDDFITFKLPLPWRICVGCSLLLLLYQVFGITLGTESAYAAGLFSIFRRFSSPSQAMLLGVSCAFALMLLLTLLSILVPLFTLMLQSHLSQPHLASLLEREAREFLVFVLLSLVALAIFFLIYAKPFSAHTAYAASAFALVLFVLLADAWYTFHFSLLPANAIPIFHRMGALTAGVSPLLPVLFLIAGLYLWSWQALAGNALLHCGRPRLPRLSGQNQIFGWVSRLYTRLTTTLPPLGGGKESLGKRLFRKLTTDAPLMTYESGTNRLGRSRYRMSAEMGKRIVNACSPVSLGPQIVGPPALLTGAAVVFFHHDLPLLGIESHAYAVCLNLFLLLAFFLTACEAARLFWTWREFKRLLTELSRQRLRRTFAKLRAVDANSLWSVSGDVYRVQYHFYSQQLDAVIRLSRRTNLPEVVYAADCGREFARINADRINNGPKWDEDFRYPNAVSKLVNIRTLFADTAAEVFNKILVPRWDKETTSLSLENCEAKADEKARQVFDMELSKDETVRAAEEFVCFQYIAFIQNILARMRTMVLAMIYLFLAVCFAVSFYPFVPRTQTGLWMLVNLVLIGSSVIYVYAGMERDETLSYIANTRPGQLSGAFWIKTAGFLAGPVIGLLTTQFPSIAESVLGWLQPGLNAIK